MKDNISFKGILLIFTLITLCIFNTSSQVIRNLSLNKGDICREDPDMIFVCAYARDCPTFKESIITRNYLDICGIICLEPIVCCPTMAIEPLIKIPETKNKKSTTAEEFLIDNESENDEQSTIKNESSTPDDEIPIDNESENDEQSTIKNESSTPDNEIPIDNESENDEQSTIKNESSTPDNEIPIDNESENDEQSTIKNESSTPDNEIPIDNESENDEQSTIKNESSTPDNEIPIDNESENDEQSTIKNESSTSDDEIPIDNESENDDQSTIIHDNSRITDKRCEQYTQLARPMVRMEAVGGTPVEHLEFPHMALIGHGDTTEYGYNWKCAGSLISERWILTAAHCKSIENRMARWARLGVIDRVVKKGSKIQPKDYRIVQHVIYPDYKPSSRYNDIALFRLERDVEFSDAVRPICLNSNPSFTPLKQILTGWGRISTAGPASDNLLKVELDIYPIKQCNESYYPTLQFGILPHSMICAGSFDGKKDSCTGDSGGPLQLENRSYNNMYTQYGITSFGRMCADKDHPAVYTKVANYISWIEEIAFSNN